MRFIALTLVLLSFMLFVSSRSEAQSAEDNYEIIFFLSPTCPICKYYCKYMRELPEQLNSDIFHCRALVPGDEFDVEEIEAFKHKYKLPFDFTKDVQQEHLSLNATITPEVFVLNGQHEILSHGRIGDSYLHFGKKRTFIKDNNLDNALNAIQA